MKSETQIAEGLIKLRDNEIRKYEHVWEGRMSEHIQSCKRFLEFLKEHEIEIGLAYGDSATVSQSPDWLKHKMIDIENAIKLHNEAGI